MKPDTFRTKTVNTSRDVSIFEFNSDYVLVVGCDSAGGIGPKPLDVVKVSGYTLGKFTARVALMEVLSVGATPVCLTNTLGVEPDPTGLEIVKGINSEVARLDSSLEVIGSMEKIVDVQQTGIGVTVVGLAPKNKLKLGLSKPDDVIVAVGHPSVKDDVLPAEKRGVIADLQDLLMLLKCGFVHDVIPVGSHGMLHEVNVLTKDAGLTFQIEENVTVDVQASAGPGTVILVTVSIGDVSKIAELISKPVNIIGSLCQK